MEAATHEASGTSQLPIISINNRTEWSTIQGVIAASDLRARPI